MIKVKDLSISFSGQQIFEEADIIINKDEKIGLIGRNGSGKSTFLKLLLGRLEADSGSIEIPKNYKIGYLEQHLKFNHPTIIEEVCSVLPKELEYESWKGEEILKGLGFLEEDMTRNPSEFSGGYQIKINLARLLLMSPDLLLLDEPTNYLDICSIRWLKSFLKEWEGALVLITHDRGFMDSIITHTLIIHRGQFRKTPGTSQHIYDKITNEEEIYEKTRLNEERKRQKTQEWIDRFKAKATMATRVQSRIKMLDKQENKEKLQEITNLEFKFNHLPYNGKDSMAEVEDLSFGYNHDQLLIKKLSFRVKTEDKICIIGRNGKGKSTLLKLLVGNLSPLAGEIKINNKTRIGYFGQMNIDQLNPELTICQEIESANPNANQTTIRRICGNMMFSGDLAHKKIAILSGGEKSRVMLGKILLTPVNLLFLDEPTNHLDMESCDSLMLAIKAFPGPVLMVTHNEYFLNNVANKLIIFDDNRVFVFEGGYQDFLRRVGWKDEQRL